MRRDIFKAIKDSRERPIIALIALGNDLLTSLPTTSPRHDSGVKTFTHSHRM